jgi:two-component system sensor histidine kinase VicK
MVLIAYVDKYQCYRFNNEAYQTGWDTHQSRFMVVICMQVQTREYQHSTKIYRDGTSGKPVTYENDITFKMDTFILLNVTYIPHIPRTRNGEARIFCPY